MRVYYDRDADLNLIKGKQVAIVGYGSQGTPMALQPEGFRGQYVRIVRCARIGLRQESRDPPLSGMEVAEAAKGPKTLC